MTWEEFKDTRIKFHNFIDQTKVPTDIVCPKCGKMVYRDDFVIYASMPPKCKYFCDKCDWFDYA